MPGEVVVACPRDGFAPARSWSSRGGPLPRTSLGRSPDVGRRSDWVVRRPGDVHAVAALFAVTPRPKYISADE